MLKYCITILLTVQCIVSLAQKKSQTNWQQRVDYAIDVTLEDQSHFLHGHIKIDYTNNSPESLSFIYMHIWPNGYRNNETAFAKQMEENGELDFFYSKPKDRGFLDSLTFATGSSRLQIEETEHIDVIKIILAKPLQSGETVELSSPFRVKLPKVFSRLGHQGQNYFITQWYPKPAVFDVNGWNPMPYLNLGEFYSEFGSFTVNITVPSNYTVVATGESASEASFAKKSPLLKDTVPPSSPTFKTVKFEANDVHDFAWFASKQWSVISKTMDVNGTKVEARVVAIEPNEKDLDHIETAIQYYSEQVGIYPYSHATVVNGQLKAGGGMEYPMITLCDFMNEEVIVHEVGHNWFYGILANNERTYPWMDESINSYYEGEAMGTGDKSFDFNVAITEGFIKDNMLRNEHQAIASTSQELTKGNYGMSVYGIGAKSFGYLKAFLGDGVFKKCMTTYYQEWKFKHPLPDDMKNSFEKTSGQELDWFFDELLASDKVLDYSIQKYAGGYTLTNVGSIAAPVPVELVLKGKKLVKWYKLQPGESKNIIDDSKTKEAVIDPYGVSLDNFTNNNRLKIPVKLKPFAGIDKPDFKEVYVLPLVGWNNYDKTMFGVGIHNYALSNKALQYHIFPMYSFGQKTVVGTAEINYTKPFSKTAQFLEIGAKGSSFSFEALGSRNKFQYAKVAPYIEYHFPKDEARSPVSQSLKLQYDYIAMMPQFEIERDTLFGPVNATEGSRNFATLRYNKTNKRPINGYTIDILAEYGVLTRKNIVGDTANKQKYADILDSAGNVINTTYYFPRLREELQRNSLMKLSAVAKYFVDMGIKDKPLELRAYGSYIIKNVDGFNEYQNTIGSTNKAGYYDYRFDDYLMNRNAETGLFQNQISNRRDFTKFVGLLADNESWMLSFNATVPLLGKLPFKPYVELLTFEDIDKESWNTKEAKLVYNVGLEVEIIPNKFEIFFNLLQSEDVTNYQENVFYPSNITGFAERITFVLDFNSLTFPRFKRGLKLF